MHRDIVESLRHDDVAYDVLDGVVMTSYLSSSLLVTLHCGGDCLTDNIISSNYCLSCVRIHYSRCRVLEIFGDGRTFGEVSR